MAWAVAAGFPNPDNSRTSFRALQHLSAVETTTLWTHEGPHRAQNNRVTSKRARAMGRKRTSTGKPASASQSAGGQGGSNILIANAVAGLARSGERFEKLLRK